MKKTELKKILKPLVTECIKEVMFEDGVLSGIITEVARGIAATTITAEPPPPAIDPVVERMQRNAFEGAPPDRLADQKNKLMAAIGRDAYNGVNLFEGTTPAPAQTGATHQASPMAHQAAGDPGVDISNLFGSAAPNWNAHMSTIKDGK